MRRLRQLRAMVKRAQAILAGARTGIDWHAPVWNTARWLARRESAAAVQLRYVLPGTRKKHGEGPLATPFAEFSKAIVVLLWARSRSNTGPYRCLCALRHLYGVLQRRGATEPSELRPEDLFDACIAYQAQCSSTDAAHILGTHLERIAEEADHFQITVTPLHFKNPVACRRKGRPTLDPQSLTGRIDAEKLPSLEALAAYAECTNNPLNDDERILLRATDMHIALGTRIGEALTIPLDCWVEEEIQEPQTQGVRSGTSSAPTKRYGIRYYAEKGYNLAIDWLPFQDVPLVRRAVTELTELCAPARAVAHWLESQPRRLWDYLPDTLVPVSELLTHLRYKHAEAFMLAMRTRGLQVAIPRLHGERTSESYYRAGDIEKAYAQSATRLAAISGEGGHIRLKLSDALCVKFHGQFSFDHSLGLTRFGTRVGL